MKPNKLCMMLLVLAAFAFTGCKDDPNDHHFDNKLYISSGPVYSDLLIKEDVTEASRTITTRLAMPASDDITVKFEARPEMAADYNMIYSDKASALPAEYYEIPEKVSRIKKGDVSGNDIVVNFMETQNLDRNRRYVLPVTIASATNIDVLPSKNTIYFVFKGAALINVVASVAKMYFPVNWSNEARPLISSMSVITVEALLRSSDWEAGRDNALSTVFGIEGQFLIRIGDADRPRNQLQLSYGGGWPAANAAPGLPVDEWIHIAIVYDSTTGERIYYQNGVVVAQDNGANRIVSLSSNCNIGMSWDTSRYLPGEVSEMRVWNIQRTAQQIAENPYYVDPASEGLVAYWKFNEGEGNIIYDATGNGTTLTARPATAADSGIPEWINVELPPIRN